MQTKVLIDVNWLPPEPEKELSEGERELLLDRLMLEAGEMIRDGWRESQITVTMDDGKVFKGYWTVSISSDWSTGKGEASI